MADLTKMVQPRLLEKLKMVGRHKISGSSSQLSMHQQQKLQGLTCKNSKYEIGG